MTASMIGGLVAPAVRHPSPNPFRAQDQDFDLGVDLAGETLGICLLTGYLFAAGCHALHDLLLDG